jgi:hypothetical protein
VHHPEACTLKGVLAHVRLDDQNEDFVHMHSARIQSKIKNYTLEYKHDERLWYWLWLKRIIIHIRGVASPHWTPNPNDH